MIHSQNSTNLKSLFTKLFYDFLPYTPTITDITENNVV